MASQVVVREGHFDWLATLIAAAALWALWRWKAGIGWVVAASATVGALLSLAGFVP
jgi:hypothetical protein